MKATVGLFQDTDGVTEVLAKIEGLATAQNRMEVLLAEIQKDLSSLAQNHNIGEVNVTGLASDSQGGLSQPMSWRCSDDDRGMTQLESPTEKMNTGSDIDSQRAEGEVPPSLPSNWPASVRIRQDLMNAAVLRRLGNSLRRPGTFATLQTMATDFGEPVLQSEGPLRRVMVDPNSTGHMVYSLLSLLVLLHDLLVIPYMLAWDLQVQGLSFVTAWISCCFWTIDVGVSCITGVHESGRLEMRPYFVLRRYARSWLLPDAVVVFSDWLGLLLAAASEDGEPSAGIRVLRFAKAGKLLRLLSLLRMMRAVRIIEDLVDGSLSDAARISLRCVLVVCGMLWVNHLVGCAWFAVGRAAPSDTGMRWIESSKEWDGENVRFLQHALPHQYIVSLHWSMAQFTLGAMDIAAVNSFERIYNIICMALGLIFGSTLVSTLSASMVDYQMTRNDQIQKLRKLRRFLRENNISRSVATLVQQQAKERLSMQAKIQEEDVQALRLLSTSLRTTLRYERYKDHLCGHAFFRLWMDMDNNLVRELCMEAVESAMLRPHDDLFLPGGAADKAHHLVAGQLLYSQEPTTAPVQQVTVMPVELHRWFCEAALWTKWVNVGTAKARTPCQVLSLSGSALMAILTKHPKYGLVAEVAAEYSRAFHRRMVAARPPQSSWPNDLEVPFTEYSDLVVGMDQDMQVTIGEQALEQLRARRQAPAAQESVASLGEEVRKGKSCVMVNAEGQIERVVSVVVMEMENIYGQVLVELCKKDKSQPLDGSCQLPGIKQEAGEILSSTLARLLSRFHLQQDDVRVASVVRGVEWKDSKEFGVRTKYIRTIHRIQLLHDLPVPALALTHGPKPAGDEAVTYTASHVSQTSMASLTSDFLEASLYKIQSGDKSIFYTWLAPDRFRHLQGPGGEKELRRGLMQLNEHNLEDLAV